MKKKGDVTKIEVMFLILFAFIVAIFFGAIWIRSNGAASWEDIYAKEIAKMINAASPGDTISIDIQKVSEVAKKNNAFSQHEMIEFDNSGNQICLKLSGNGKTCYSYFNNVDIIWSGKVELGPPNLLIFNISEKQN